MAWRFGTISQPCILADLIQVQDTEKRVSESARGAAIGSQSNREFARATATNCEFPGLCGIQIEICVLEASVQSGGSARETAPVLRR